MVRVGLANQLGATLVFVYFTYVVPDAPGQTRFDEPRYNLLAWAAFVAVAMPVGFANGWRLLRPVRTWLAGGRPATEAERYAVLSQPWWQAKWSFVYWMAAVVVFGVLNIAISGERRGAEAAQAAVGTVLGGLTTSLLTFFIVEQYFRPLVAEALAGVEPTRPIGVGIGLRFVLAWALGSGVPLVGILIAPVGRTWASREDLLVPALFLAALGLPLGGLLVLIAARSVAEPIARVRQGMRRVQDGDLDVVVPVDDGGDLGLLEAGFNRMVEGLREHQQLRDLFGRHVGAEVARQALARDPGLGGEQREASALFVDLIGSTSLAQKAPPHEVVATLNALFDAVVRVIDAEGGWVNKFEGDGALCVFGAPADQPDHADRALRAARALRAELVRLAARHPQLDAGIAVSSGGVLAGNVGAERRYEYTVIGDPVNEAARLTELAKDDPGRVLASEEAVARASEEEAARWRLVGEFPLRGRRSPTCAFAPVGP